MENTIYFNLPGLYFKKEITTRFLYYLRDYPDRRIPNTEVGAIYDSIPYCLWNGGRIFLKYPQATQEDLEDINYIFAQEFHKPIRLIFTNGYIQEKHLKDTFCNLVTDYFHNENNEVVVNSPLLEQYLRENYPKYKIISSTTKCMKNWDLVHEELAKDYYQVCLDYNLNHNLKQLKNFSEKEKEKTEFLINAICNPGCPHRAEHYKLNSIATLNYNQFFRIECSLPTNTLGTNTTHISPEEIETIYAPLGFKNYKIEGRTLCDLEVLCNYVKFMIKPEHQLSTIVELLGTVPDY